MKQKLNVNLLILYLLLLMIIISCEKKGKDGSPYSNINNLIVSFEHPDSSQKFKIIKAYKLFNPYFDELERNPNLSSKDIYIKSVIDPVFNTCFADAEHIYMANSILNKVQRSIQKLKS